MATAKRKRRNTSSTSLVKNTARQVTLKGNAARTTALRANPKRKRATVKKQVRSRRRYRRNGAGSGIFDGLIPAFTGALAINFFDLGVNTLAPNLGSTIRTGAKFVAGFGVKMWGKKIPVIGAYSQTIGNALFLAGSLDLVATYVMPYVAGAIAQAKSTVSGVLGNQQVVATSPTTDPATGQMGQAYRLGNGDTVEVFRRGGNRNRSFVY